MHLKANKTSLYRLVASFEKLPTMNKTEFIKAPRHPDYILKWFDGESFCTACVAACLGVAVLSIEKRQAGEKAHFREVHRLSIEDLHARGMIEAA